MTRRSTIIALVLLTLACGPRVADDLDDQADAGEVDDAAELEDDAEPEDDASDDAPPLDVAELGEKGDPCETDDDCLEGLCAPYIFFKQADCEPETWCCAALCDSAEDCEPTEICELEVDPSFCREG